tara:strand:- start:228 stop:488 length:261 start_codon:yes stop_codon:yes gene_type:complete
MYPMPTNNTLSIPKIRVIEQIITQAIPGPFLPFGIVDVPNIPTMIPTSEMNKLINANHEKHGRQPIRKNNKQIVPKTMQAVFIGRA